MIPRTRVYPPRTNGALAHRRQKGLRSIVATPIRNFMSDTIRNDAAHSHWKRLYEAAILELDPAKLLQRIALAQSAVLDQLEDDFSKPSAGKQLALQDALHMLSTLRMIAERDIGEQRRTSKCS